MNFNSPDDCLELVSRGIDEQERMVVLVANNRYVDVRPILLSLLNSRTDICGFRHNHDSHSYYFKNGSAVHIVSDNEPKHRLRGYGPHKNITIGNVKQDALTELI